ncbi:MAG: MFS transporter [Lachnospiraceae bacterium]
MEKKEKKSTLWNKNFTIITFGTIISAIGGTAMSFAMSIVVFDNSQSTLLAGIFSAVSLIPAMVLPIVVSPYLDRFKRKPVIVGLDAIDGILYLIFGIYLMKFPFSYPVYMLFGLITSSTGTIYNLAYTSLYPNLIEKGFAQKGYTISGMIYPTVMVIMTPAAGFLYSRFGMEFICILEGILLVLASLIETQIKIKEKVNQNGKFSVAQYFGDLKEGWDYLRKEKGLQRIYAYMPITQGIGQGNSSLVIAFFQTTPGFGTALYAWFTVAEFLGRTIGGVIHYKFEIKSEKRFGFAYLVYQTYNLMDGILLLLGYPFMLMNRAVCGFLGINSATLRESSVQNYIPDDKRAKLNALFSAITSLSCMVCYGGIGMLGEIMDYKICLLVTSSINIIFCYLIMYRGKNQVKEIYNKKY